MPARRAKAGGGRETAISKLRRIARPKAKGHPPVLLPELASRIHERSPLKYAQAYYRKRVRASFASPLAADFDFVVERPAQITYKGRSGAELVAAIQDELFHYHEYLSAYLTHPRYGPENECGFSRGDTLEPVGLREVSPGKWEFRIRGIAVGRADLLKKIVGQWRTKHGPKPPNDSGTTNGATRIYMTMPTRPDAREVDSTEWYEFNPDEWIKNHPKIPLRPSIPVVFRERHEEDLLAPRYDELYQRGTVRIAFLFGYDDEGHNTTKDAKGVWRVLTAPPSRRFTKAETGEWGYHGLGLGFADPTRGLSEKLDLTGADVFARGHGIGSGPLSVKYVLKRPLLLGTDGAPEGSVLISGRVVPAHSRIRAGTRIERRIGAEVRLYNFDKSTRLSADTLNRQFASVFKNNDVVLYDGHANYGGGFYIGQRGVDILWAVDIGAYKRLFADAYQIFAIGACHAAGYFADLFYNELHPRKTPRNFDVVAAVNETAFLDANHQMLALLRTLLQLDVPEKDEPIPYRDILLRQSRPASFQAYIGVFGDPSGARAAIRKGRPRGH